jgi:hypothetical protein
VEKLTSLGKANKLKNMNLVLDISEDLRAKSKKFRKEMEKFSLILETEISESNNVSGNRTNSNFNKVNKYESLNTLNNFKKNNLMIKTTNDNPYDKKYFKKINYDPKTTTKKFSLFKDSPYNIETKFQEKLMDMSKPNNYNNQTKTNKSEFENNKFFKEKPILNNFNKIYKIKDIRGIFNLN